MTADDQGVGGRTPGTARGAASGAPRRAEGRRPGWGIVGTGSIARLFAEGLACAHDARLVAVASRRRETGEAFAAAFGASRVHATCEALARDPEVDVVYVATPTELHAEHALLVIAEGKGVLVEKPFALDAAQGAAVAQAARRRGVFCMEGMWMRCAPAVQEAIAAVRGGRVGEVRLVAAQLGFSRSPDPASRLFRSPGGGALLDLGVYPLSLAQALLGRPERATLRAVRGDAVDEQAAMVLEYRGGAQAVLAASLRAQLGNAASVHGTHGVVEIGAPLWFPQRYEITPVAPAAPAAARPPAPGRPRLRALRTNPVVAALADLRRALRRRPVVRRVANGYAAEAEEVGRCLRAGRTESAACPLDDTLAVLETLDALRGGALRTP